ncbi:hypothetical protein Holit_02433 [Hollandina sp. SP2]
MEHDVYNLVIPQFLCRMILVLVVLKYIVIY